MARTTNFADLNFDSLLLIFKHLNNLEDQVNLARCCQLLRAAFVYYNRHRFTEIIDNDIKLKSWEEWSAFLCMCGTNVKSLQTYYDDEHPLQLLPLVSRFCTNLEDITLNNVTVAKSQPYLLEMRSLRKVHVRNYKSTSKDLIKSMLSLPHIRSLGLDCFDRRELLELRHFKELEELQLYNEVTAAEFVSIIKSMRNLRILQLRSAKNFLNTNSLKQLASHCRQLEKLCFFDSDAELWIVGQFSKLKYLQLSCPEQMKPRLFKALASKSASHLTYLILHRRRWINEEQARHIGELAALKLLICKPRDDACLSQLARLSQLECLSLQCSRQIGEAALMEVLCANPKLRFLNICYCSGLTDDFLMAVMALQAQRALAETFVEQPVLEIYAAATDIRRDIMERLPADFRSKWLLLFFECSDGIFCDGHFYFDDPEFDR